MNFFRSILLAGLITGTGIAHAIEQPEHYIEDATIILNLQALPNSERAKGYLLATACNTCKPTRFEVNESTELYINGAPSTPKKIGLKIDWQGTVFFTPGTPPTATRLMLN